MGCEDILICVGIKRPRGPDFQTTSLMILAVLLLLIVCGVSNLGMKPRQTYFVEGDPTLSYPYIKDADASVSSPLLVMLSIGLPLIVICLFHTALYGREFFAVGTRVQKRLLVTILWFALCCLTAISVTSVLKNYNGRLRPDFFALCNYKGFRTVMDMCQHSTDWTTCIAQYPSYSITPGAPGNFDNCLDQDMLTKGQHSYPSGHSSLSMAGFGFLAYFLYYSFDGTDFFSGLLRMFLPAACVFGAIMIAASRPHDYWHNYSDINFGMSIGFACFVFSGRCWKRHMVIRPITDAEPKVDRKTIDPADPAGGNWGNSEVRVSVDPLSNV